MTKPDILTPFNTALETGIRALAILDAVFPATLDLQRLVDFDYLVVHTGDVGGPKSLHAPLPMRTGEILVRREIIEDGLLLMMSRGLVQRLPSSTGIQYIASDTANPFLSALGSLYIIRLRERATWVVGKYQNVPDEELKRTIRHFFDLWTIQFQPIESALGSSQ